jgi:hypothetical protein
VAVDVQIFRYEVLAHGQPAYHGGEMVYTFDVCPVGDPRPIQGGSFRGPAGQVLAAACAELLNRTIR